MRTQVALLLGRSASRAARLVGAGAGETLPGTLALKVAPDLLPTLARGRRIAVVSATNGKTTTTRMLAAALGRLTPTLSNSSGSNLARGVLASLMTDPRGRFTTCAFEVDELALQPVAKALRPQLFLLSNLSRDQLDRMAEVGAIVGRWQQTLAESARQAAEGGGPAPVVVANADDPMVANAVLSGPDGTAVLPTVWVSVGQPWRVDSASCPRCARAWAVGEDYQCETCGFRRPTADWRLDDDELVDPDGRRRRLDLGLPGWSNRANAVLATVAAAQLGADVDASLAAIRPLDAIGGRYAQGVVGDVPVRLLLAKNPAGWMEMLDQAAAHQGEDGRLPVVLALNANEADGKDTSWIWDVPFEKLIGRDVWVSGERGADLALRLRYAEIDCRLVSDPLKAVRTAGAAGGEVVDLLCNYTAFTAARARLGLS